MEGIDGLAPPARIRIHTRRQNGRPATLGCSGGTRGFAWQFTTEPRLRGAPRASPRMALDAWLLANKKYLDEAAAADVRDWVPPQTGSEAPLFEGSQGILGEQASSSGIGPPHAPGAAAGTAAAAPPEPAPPAPLQPAQPLPIPPCPPAALAPALAPQGAEPDASPFRNIAAPCWAMLDGISLVDEFSSDCPTMRYVPGGARAALAQATEEVCRAVLHAPEGTVHEERAWKLLMLRERLLLYAPLRLSQRRPRRSASDAAPPDKARLVRERAGAFIRGEWADLLSDARSSSRRLTHSRQSGGVPQQSDAHVADEVVRKTLAGEYSRAVALLASPGLAPATLDTAQQLQDLLQPRLTAAPLAPAARRLGESQELFNMQCLRVALRSSPRGSGAAVGGGRFEHWKALLGHDSAIEAMHAVCVRLAQGRVPESIAAAIGLSKLAPLRKAGGGVRPIAAPNILRRLVGRILTSSFKTRASELLAPHQFAIGESAGAELLAHTAKALIEADPSLVLVKLDARNAFCTISRSECLAAFSEMLPELVPFVELFCNRTSQYAFWDATGHCHRLRATDGVDQGDPMAPLLFACGMRSRLRRLESQLRAAATDKGQQPSSVTVLAFLDDVVAAVPAALAPDVVGAASAHLAEIGLELRPDKTQAWSPATTCPEGMEEQWCANGITVVGVPVGEALPEGNLPAEGDNQRVDLGGADFASQQCEEVVARTATVLEKLADLPSAASPHLPAVQVAALLLRTCCVGKITHLLRTTPPASVEPAAIKFDEAVLRCYETVAQLDPLTPPQEAQCRLPLREGGRGLRSQAAAAPAAWVASWAQCLAGVRVRSGVASLADMESCPLPLAVACRAAVACLPISNDDAPAWRDLAVTARPKFQRILGKQLDQKNSQALLSTMDIESRARLRSCGGPLAAGWLLAAPGETGQQLTDSEYRLTARSLLGQRVAPPSCTGCQHVSRTGNNAGRPCGERLDDAAHHAHRCARGGGTKARSRDLEHVWEQIHKECGYLVRREVPVAAWDRFRTRCAACGATAVSHNRPSDTCVCGAPVVPIREEAVLDLEVQHPGAPLLYLDVTVRHSVPGDRERLAKAAAANGAINSEAETDKRSRYPRHAGPQHVIPLALETFGRHGTASLKYLRRLARSQAERAGVESEGTASALTVRWGARLSVALHRANCRNVQSALGTASFSTVSADTTGSEEGMAHSATSSA